MSGFLHKVFGTKEGDGMQPKEAVSYSIAGLGQNLICGLVGSYLVYYMTNGLLIPSVTVGFIMLAARLFDAFNDPIMGSIVDFTRSKYGKCRPYLLFMPIPIAILTVALFLPMPTDAKGHATTLGIALVTSIYIIWGIAYTIVDVPYWGLATSMTNDTNQRGVVLTVARLFCTIGGGAIALFVPLITGGFLKPFTNSDGEIAEGLEQSAAHALTKNYVWIAVVIVVLALPTFYLGFKYTKERYYSNEKPKTLGHNLKLLGKNKPLLLIILSGVLGGGKSLYIYSGIFFAQYALADVAFLGMKGVQLVTVITLSVIPGGLAASVLTPYFTKKFGKKNTYIYSHLFGAVVMFIMYFVGWRSSGALVFSLIGLILVGIPYGFGNIISYAMIADTVDYLELETGERGEGICFACQTFINKIGMALGAAFACFGLAIAKINPADASTFTLHGKNVLFLVTVLIPAVSMALTAVPLFFYKFDEKAQAEAVRRIEERKKATSNE